MLNVSSYDAWFETDHGQSWSQAFRGEWLGRCCDGMRQMPSMDDDGGEEARGSALLYWFGVVLPIVLLWELLLCFRRRVMAARVCRKLRMGKKLAVSVDGGEKKNGAGNAPKLRRSPRLASKTFT
jgi:hypothetical protein